MQLRTQLIGSFLLIALVSVAINTINIWTWVSTTRAVETHMARTMPFSEDLDQLSAGVGMLERESLGHALLRIGHAESQTIDAAYAEGSELAGAPEWDSSVRSLITAEEADFRRHCEDARQLCARLAVEQVPGTEDAVAHLCESVETLIGISASLIEVPGDTNIGARAVVVLEGAEKVEEQAEEQIERARRRVFQMVEDNRKESTRRIGQAQALAISMSVFAVALVVILGALVQRHVSRPLSALTDGARRLASGERQVRIAGSPRAEIGELVRVFNDMSACLESRECELSESNRRLEDARAAAESATRSKSEFLANMSHEIRTPMTSILGYADLLLEDPQARQLEPESLDGVVAIKRNGTFLLGLINDILDLSKVEAGKLVVESVGCAPAEIIADVVSLMGARAKEQGLELRVECASPIPDRIETDPTRVRQILFNLLGNAIKFTQQGSVRLIVSCLREGPHAWMQFDVIDTGIGMTPDEVAVLFRPFSQADPSTSRRFGGTGLGLTICKRMAALLGGDVSVVASRPGGGTHFRVSVACGDLSEAVWQTDSLLQVSREDAAARSDDATTLPTLCDYRILLAEDGIDNRRLIARILEKAGATVDTAENGQIACNTALRAWQAGQPYAIVLMDMQMPVMDGYAATRALRAAGYRGAILALTAHAMNPDRQKCLDAGCDDYASKPVQRRKLLTQIQKLTAGVSAAT